MSDNLSTYNQVRKVPPEALREIQAGRLRGKSDINPMWRLKTLTEQFGLCGIGWKYVIIKQWLESGGKDEIAAFVNIDLFIKLDGVWSDAIPGTGGSSFVANEKNGPYMSDECFKMALTDAISVSCKALGFAADVYWEKDSTKYSRPPQPALAPSPKPEQKQPTGAKLTTDKAGWTSASKPTGDDEFSLVVDFQNSLTKLLELQPQLGLKTEPEFVAKINTWIDRAAKASKGAFEPFEIRVLTDLAKVDAPIVSKLIESLTKSTSQMRVGQSR